MWGFPAQKLRMGVVCMKKDRAAQLIQSVCCLAVVVVVMVVSYLYREQIEAFSATGYLGVFISCIAATSTVLLPAPGILVVVRYASLLNPVLVVLLGGIGTAIGEIAGYILGRSGNAIAQIDTSTRGFGLIHKRPKLMIFLFSLIPLPVFDIVGICAGMVKVHPVSFLLSCSLGKILKMGIYVVLCDFLRNMLPNL